MIVQNEFDVPGSVSEVFTVVTDIERVARCFPGATLDQAIDDDTYKGQIEVRLGPVQVSFAGKLEFLERDHENASAMLRARGKERKGRGGADANIEMTLMARDNEVTTVNLNTDLKLVGAVAQYGRGAGVIQGVAEQIIGKFAQNMQADLRGEELQGDGAVSGISVVAKAVTRNLKDSITSRKDNET